MSLAPSTKTDDGSDLRFLEALPLLSPMTNDRLAILKVADSDKSFFLVGSSFLALSSFNTFFFVLGVCISFSSFGFCLNNAAPSGLSSDNFILSAGTPINRLEVVCFIEAGNDDLFCFVPFFATPPYDFLILLVPLTGEAAFFVADLLFSWIGVADRFGDLFFVFFGVGDCLVLAGDEKSSE